MATGRRNHSMVFTDFADFSMNHLIYFRSTFAMKRDAWAQSTCQEMKIKDMLAR